MKISVVTVCFNSEATIADTVRSFLDQDYNNKELIVVDGNSKDNTLKIVEAFGAPEIRVISEPDKGPYDAMNKGLRAYTGDVVGILNSDDTFHNTRSMSLIADGLQDADIVYGDLEMVTDHGTKTVVREWRAGAYGRRSFQFGWMPPHPTFYARRHVIELVGEYDLSYKTTADYDFTLRAIALNDFRVHYIRHVLADFQMGGISTKSWKTTFRASLELLRSRHDHLHSSAIDLAFFMWPLRRIFQVRRLGPYLIRQKAVSPSNGPPSNRFTATLN